MFIAMNRFKIALGREQDFINIWKNRDSHLETVPGFKEFHLLQGPTTEEYTLFSSHATWETKEDFENWTKSEAFRQAHANAGDSKGIYLGHPNFEGFEAVI
ncbi:MAG: antibiotic biosynthesis monooxygenase [Pseudomonadales bacterium]|nr:antibiotic biosynthesis monooxygenase [Pseudomonadales bacterium]